MADTDQAPKLRMNAYHYGFDNTDVPEIDLILSAVACAGKSCHHTNRWEDEIVAPFGHEGGTPVDWIANAARKAAMAWRSRADLAPAPLPAPDHRLGYWCGLVRGEPFQIFLKATSSAKNSSYEGHQPDQWVYLGPLPDWLELDK